MPDKPSDPASLTNLRWSPDQALTHARLDTMIYLDWLNSLKIVYPPSQVRGARSRRRRARLITAENVACAEIFRWSREPKP